MSILFMPHLLLSPLGYLLLLGATGKTHLAETAREAFRLAGEEGRHELVELGRDLLVAAWLSDPLDGVLAAAVSRFEADSSRLSPELGRSALAVSRAWRPPEEDRRLCALEQAGDYSILRRYLLKGLEAKPSDFVLYWLLLFHAFARLDLETAEKAVVGLATIPPMQPLAAMFSADLHFLSGRYAEAARGYRSLTRTHSFHVYGRLAEALLRDGDRDTAIDILREAWRARPWQTNLLLRLHDLVLGIDGQRAMPPGRTAILLYSYDKAAELDLTLESLAASGTGDAIIRVLSNGCRDSTGVILRKWRDAFGERFDTIELPVNVGAAPARNWLASLPEVRACAFAVYLDDDVRLPADWLSVLGAAVRVRPEASVWGSRVVDFGRPANLQQVDLSLVQPRSGDTLFSFSNLQNQELDFGQFGYLRPCVSVTGCCHLLRTEALLKTGGFDLRYSPTQYDDLDHDLRLGLAGHEVVYQGHLRVEHRKVSGRSVRRDQASTANAIANMYKLKNKLTAGDVALIIRETAARLEADWRGRIATLGEAESPC